jgi:maltooligosyltrehalose synthase
VTGSKRDHVFAFARRQGRRIAVAAAVRFFTRLTPDLSQLPLGASVWGDTAVVVPLTGVMSLRNVLTAREFQAGSAAESMNIPAAELFSDLPVALLQDISGS